MAKKTVWIVTVSLDDISWVKNVYSNEKKAEARVDELNDSGEYDYVDFYEMTVE